MRVFSAVCNLTVLVATYIVSWSSSGETLLCPTRATVTAEATYDQWTVAELVSSGGCGPLTWSGTQVLEGSRGAPSLTLANVINPSAQTSGPKIEKMLDINRYRVSWNAFMSKDGVKNSVNIANQGLWTGNSDHIFSSGEQCISNSYQCKWGINVTDLSFAEYTTNDSVGTGEIISTFYTDIQRVLPTGPFYGEWRYRLNATVTFNAGVSELKLQWTPNEIQCSSSGEGSCRTTGVLKYSTGGGTAEANLMITPKETQGYTVTVSSDKFPSKDLTTPVQVQVGEQEQELPVQFAVSGRPGSAVISVLATLEVP